jgi:cyclopropane-fatty-acyl-phospholipid synthase
MQGTGFEVRHVESLREHYALTLRAWVRNLEVGWDEAVAEVGSGRARVWRLYMAASALNFEAARTQVHQVLAVRSDGGRSGLPLRPRFEERPLQR